MTPHLDLIIAHNPIRDCEERYKVERELDTISRLQGFTFNLNCQGEDYLFKDANNKKIFPEQSLLYVHGGLVDRHLNFDRVLEISPLRPDLRFVVDFDDLSSQLDFKSRETYEQYRGLPILGKEGDKSVEVYSQIIASHRSQRRLFPKIEEGSPMAEYILYLVGRTK
ncbi:MAG: hypothetical protein WCV90_08015 [Candidatus Woesearchaeota archaeon]|jgi:hypothetical protein